MESPSAETQNQKSAIGYSGKFLPKPDKEVLKEIGTLLKNSRKKSIDAAAKAAKVEPKILEEIERGIILQGLGSFRHIIRKAYGLNLEDVLAKHYDKFEARFNVRNKRFFARDIHYAICLQPHGKKEATPFLVGGDPESFLWAVPFRKLKKQPLTVDLLELAPNRVKKSSGKTPGGSHDGVEVVHVINGSIKVTIATNTEASVERTLRKGETIHFNSKNDHQISNEGTNTPALLLIVRLNET